MFKFYEKMFKIESKIIEIPRRVKKVAFLHKTSLLVVLKVSECLEVLVLSFL